MSVFLPSTEQFVKTKRAATVSYQEEEDNQKQQGCLTSIEDRPKALRQMCQHELGGRHLPSQHERDGTREKPDDNREAAEEFEHACKPHKRKEWCHRARLATESSEDAKQLLGTMLHVEGPRDDAQ